MEVWLGDEKRMITRTTAVFVPAGMPHCPLVFHSVDRPFIFITTGNGFDYEYGDAPGQTAEADVPGQGAEAGHAPDEVQRPTV